MPTVGGQTITLADRVRETTQTTGTGTYSLDGAPTGKRTFVAGIGNGNKTLYAAELGSSWEIGIGTVTSGAPATLSRDVILASSNSNNAVNWGAGVKSIFCDIAAALANQIWNRPGGVLPLGAIETRGPTTPTGSQSAIDFTSIASTAKIIHGAYAGLNANTVGVGLRIQIGDSGGFETSGYFSALHTVTATNDLASGAFSTVAFILTQAQPTATTLLHSGSFTLVHVGSGLWTFHGVAATDSNTNDFASSGAGHKQLSGTLDRLSFNTSAGTNFAAVGNISLQIIHAVS